MIYFSSDYHIGDGKIIDYCKRPFKDVEEMNNTIIENHNRIVNDDDVIVFLGDFCFKDGIEYLSKMKGHFQLIKGNHDRRNGLPCLFKKAIFTQHNYKIMVAHDPDTVFPGFDLYFVGHVHDHWKFKRVIRDKKKMDMINVSVDVWDFKPVSIDQLVNFYRECKTNGRK